MRLKPEVEKGRIRYIENYYSEPGDMFGMFAFFGPCGRKLKVIASCGDRELGVAWEHVSVSAEKFTPTWKEMCFVKDLFFDEEEVVMQLHPAKSKWINIHDRCLHLWRPLDSQIPLPPEIAV